MPPDSPSASVISVSELNTRVRKALEREFPLQRVGGEVSNLTRATSGHVYFTLKDEVAQARCVMFRSRAQALPWRLENGQQVEARALVSLYEARGDFQLNIEQLRRAGLGRLYEAFARLKDKLAAEGLFATETKQDIPHFPRRIGIISSPQAAAVRDVLVALRRRAPHLECVLYPTLVQGDQAAAGIAQALAQANARAECDVLLLIRGGGSIEDLWAFNEEAVARAIAASALPVISGVGHETDTTIADFVADLRAATPTAAAELASQSWFDAREMLAGFRDALQSGMRYRLEAAQQRVDRAALRLVHPATRLARHRERLNYLAARLSRSHSDLLHRSRDRLNRLTMRLQRARPQLDARRNRLTLLSQRLGGAMARQLGQHRHQLDRYAEALNHLNPQATLARGFSIVRNAEGNLIASAHSLATGQAVMIDFADGQAGAQITQLTPAPSIATPKNPD